MLLRQTPSVKGTKAASQSKYTPVTALAWSALLFPFVILATKMASVPKLSPLHPSSRRGFFPFKTGKYNYYKLIV
jgi:hypothetical protein